MYGPPVAGGPFYPTGVLGDSMAAADMASILNEAGVEHELSSKDLSAAINASSAGKVRLRPPGYLPIHLPIY